MNSTAAPRPTAIRARIHESAVKRVTRAYASTLPEILVEGFQNSRRAGATRVRMTIEPSPGSGDTQFTVTIADNGDGIADPAVLLSFGENGWDKKLVPRERGIARRRKRRERLPVRRHHALRNRGPRPEGRQRTVARARILPGQHAPLRRRKVDRRPRPDRKGRTLGQAGRRDMPQPRPAAGSARPNEEPGPHGVPFDHSPHGPRFAAERARCTSRRTRARIQPSRRHSASTGSAPYRSTAIRRSDLRACQPARATDSGVGSSAACGTGSGPAGGAPAPSSAVVGSASGAGEGTGQACRAPFTASFGGRDGEDGVGAGARRQP